MRGHDISEAPHVLRCSRRVFAVAFLLMTEHATVGSAYESTSPEAAIRAMVRANAELDMPTLSRLMAHDTDIISYTIGGRKYVGWPEFEHDMKEEFSSVAKLEIPYSSNSRSGRKGLSPGLPWNWTTSAMWGMDRVNGERCFLLGKAVSWNSAENNGSCCHGMSPSGICNWTPP